MSLNSHARAVQKPGFPCADPALTAGLVPAEWGYLARLVYLNVSRNHLEGPLPPWSFGLPSLVTLDLSVNKFSGERTLCQSGDECVTAAPYSLARSELHQLNVQGLQACLVTGPASCRQHQQCLGSVARAWIAVYTHTQQQQLVGHTPRYLGRKVHTISPISATC